MLRILMFCILFSYITYANTFLLETNTVNINTHFAGTTINLYGTQNRPGKIFVVIKGEKTTYYTQKKEKRLGIWIKGKRKEFENVYRYYHIILPSTIEKLNIPHLLKPFEIGIENINTHFSSVMQVIEDFEHKTALVVQKKQNKLFVESFNATLQQQNKLLHVPLKLPKNIPAGNYIVSIYTVFEGNITSINNLPLYIKQVGLLKYLHNAALHNKVTYFLLGIFSSIGLSAFGYFFLTGYFKTVFRNIGKTFQNLHKKPEPPKRKRGRPRKNPPKK